MSSCIFSCAHKVTMENKDTEISRITRSKDEARDIYDKISKLYDLLEGVWEKKAKETGLAKLAVEEGERVLEIGFGTGYSLVALAKSVGASGKVYGIDISPRMFNIGAARLRAGGLKARVELTLGDAVELPYKNAFFDAVFMSFTLELFDTPEIPLVLSECKRVLKKGGRICVISLSKTGGRSRMRELYEWGHQRFPRLLDCRPIFVQEALKVVGFQCLDINMATVFWMPVEIVVAINPG